MVTRKASLRIILQHVSHHPQKVLKVHNRSGKGYLFLLGLYDCNILQLRPQYNTFRVVVVLDKRNVSSVDALGFNIKTKILKRQKLFLLSLGKKM